jgi:hypothetical protein
VGTLLLGQYLGGILVYVIGLRVGESGPGSSPPET